MCPTRERERRCAVPGREYLAVNSELERRKNSHRREEAAGFYCSVVFTIFRVLQVFCLNLGSIFKPDKITIGKTNGLICGE